jgi:murein DD-endopeptidase MepM/ murein hydrolase activator NlpD
MRERRTMNDGRSGRALPRVLLLIVLAGSIAIGVAVFRTGAEPAITLAPELPGIGKRTPVRVSLTEPRRGLGTVRVELIQGDRVETLATRSHTPRAAWKLWGEAIEQDAFTVDVGSETVAGLAEAPATIRVVAERAGTWLRSPAPAVSELELAVKLRPPTLHLLSTHVYVAQGGCEAVVYAVDGSAVRDGVQAGAWWFPGHPLPGSGGNERFALFGAPYDLDDPAQIQLVASDAVRNEARRAFVDRFTPRPIRRDTIELSDAFMARVVPAIMSQAPELRERGSLLDNYLAINGDLRQRNAQELTDLAARSVPDFLWRQGFLALPQAQVMSDFADRRTYVYEGRAVDRQDHLGFDLASVRAAEVPAANEGIVVLARYFGIYGNTVVLDHGYGLMSLYGHLSSLAVAEGERVARGQTVGRTGETGLAGGDHLHFTMLLHGLAVDPREWWDPHWIRDRLELKLGPALPFEG